jgi:SAM-dependent methyltransferase
MPETRERRTHAPLDREQRRTKAERIVRLITRRRRLQGTQLLEVGTGSGYMAEVFSKAVGPTGLVWSIDRVDERQARSGFRFARVDGTDIPFAKEEFDVVISNHVLEHVGGYPDQLRHLSEIRRVLRGDGLAYLAVPNRWRLLEGHFRLPFLSWFPEPLASAYVRLAGRGDWYDVVPPSPRTMRCLFEKSGLAWQDVSIESMRLIAQVERVSPPTRALLTGPEWLLRPLLVFAPTMIFLALRGGRGNGRRESC